MRLTSFEWLSQWNFRLSWMTFTFTLRLSPLMNDFHFHIETFTSHEWLSLSHWDFNLSWMTFTKRLSPLLDDPHSARLLLLTPLLLSSRIPTLKITIKMTKTNKIENLQLLEPKPGQHQVEKHHRNGKSHPRGKGQASERTKVLKNKKDTKQKIFQKPKLRWLFNFSTLLRISGTTRLGGDPVTTPVPPVEEVLCCSHFQKYVYKEKSQHFNHIRAKK